jgi:hypothetical protein
MVLCLVFSLTLTTSRLCGKQLKVVWSPLLQTGSEGPTLISCAASWRTYELKERITLEFSGGGDDYH